MVSKLKQPPVWSEQQLQFDRSLSEQTFADHRREEGPRSFAKTYHALRPKVEAVFAATDNLRALDGSLFESDPGAWQACRYVCGPPISQEDLWTLVGATKFRTVPAHLAERTADAIRVVIDPVRFPWVDDGRAPTTSERNAGIMATTVLWSAQQLSTERRGEASTKQEKATADVLADAGMQLDPSRSPVTFLDDIQRGYFSPERRIADSKCDLPARLPDGRLLGIECKVSNGPKNGWKRLNREVAGKAEVWRGHFGSQMLTAVVVAGVFDLSCLRSAQNAGVTLFWEHDLAPLHDFIESTF